MAIPAGGLPSPSRAARLVAGVSAGSDVQTLPALPSSECPREAVPPQHQEVLIVLKATFPSTHSPQDLWATLAFRARFVAPGIPPKLTQRLPSLEYLVTGTPSPPSTSTCALHSLTTLFRKRESCLGKLAPIYSFLSVLLE